MKTDYLVQMANQIGAFFEVEAEREEALSNIANHLKKFWDPRMRRQIIAYVEEEGGTGLMEIVLQAIKRNRNSLYGGNQAILADDRWMGPAGASDAG